MSYAVPYCPNQPALIRPSPIWSVVVRYSPHPSPSVRVGPFGPCPGSLPRAASTRVLANSPELSCNDVSIVLCVYTTHDKVNSKSLPPHAGEILRGATNDYDRTPPLPFAGH